METQTAKKDRLYLDLLEACAEPGCPLCRVALTYTRQYLDGILYEHVNDPGIRETLRNARGFCNTHAWMLTEGFGILLGVAIIQRDVVHTALEVLRLNPQGRNVRQYAQELVRRLQPKAECPACTNLRTVETHALQTLLKYLNDPDLAHMLAGSSGLCLPHFTRALELVENEIQLQHVLRFQRLALHRLDNELSELIRKQDYRFRHEELGKERDAWLRATGIVSGERKSR